MTPIKEERTDLFELTQGGKVLFTGTENECFFKLQKMQGQSSSYAFKYGGWSIEIKINQN